MCSPTSYLFLYFSSVDVDDLSSRIDKLARGFLSSSEDYTGTVPAPPSILTDQIQPRKRLGSDYDNVSNGCKYAIV